MVTKKQIAVTNDLHRSTMIGTKNFRVILTECVANMRDDGDNGIREFNELMSAVRDFKDFTPDNDPHEEHDFGKVMVGKQNFFWKYDYYDESYEYGGDPNEGPVCRVLTIMHSSEY